MRRALTLGLIALLAASAAHAAPLSRSVLDNGLTVIAVQSNHIQVAGIASVINVSGTHETDENRGSRALLQQMISISSHNAVSEDLNPISGVVRGGGSTGLAVNTNWDFVETAFTVALEELDAGLELMAGELFEVELTQEELDQARELTERLWDASRESPVQATFDLFREALYGHSAMARPQQGDPESLEKITLEGLQEFRDTYYVPANAWLCIVSPLSPDAAISAVREAFGDLPARPAPPAAPPAALPGDSRVEVGDSADLIQASLVIGVPMPAYDDPLFPAAELIAAVLDGPGGRLRRDLSLLRALGLSLPTRLLDEHYPVSMLNVPPARNPYLAVHVLAAPRSIEAVRVGVLGHLLAFQSRPVTEAELDRARARAINAHRLATAKPGDAALYQARRALFGLGDADDAVAAIEAVTSEDLKTAARYFDRHAIGLQMPGS